jgi:hypothetical protein
MALLRERGGWFQLTFRYQGRQLTHALKTRSACEAEAQRGIVERVLIRIRNRDIPPVPPDADVADYLPAGGKVPEPSKPLTLKELAVRYAETHGNRTVEANSLATARMHLGRVIDHLDEGFVPRELSAQGLEGYLDRRAHRRGQGRRGWPTRL